MSYCKITELQGRQIALIHKILDEGIQPDSVKDGWECFSIERKRSEERRVGKAC